MREVTHLELDPGRIRGKGVIFLYVGIPLVSAPVKIRVISLRDISPHSLGKK